MQSIQAEKTSSNPYVLKIENLSVVRSGKLVLDDINLTIRRGEFVAIIGPNGSGKSTLLLTILGELKKKTGKIEIYAKPTSRGYFGNIAWVSQAASNLPDHIRITVQELVQLGTLNPSNLFFPYSKKNRMSVEKAIEMVGLKEVQHTDISRLSGGQRQRAVIARALAAESEFILLDEPLVGIDRDARNQLLKLLDQLCHDAEKTILLVSHDLTAMQQTAHRLVYLEETIRFDGKTEDFPNLETLASLRGIRNVHEQEHVENIQTEFDHDLEKCKTNDSRED